MNSPQVQAEQIADFEFAALSESTNYRAAILRDFSQYLTGRVLEIGAGIGHFSQELLRLGAVEHLTSIEPSSHFCQVLRQAIPHLDLIEGTVKNLNPEQHYHAIFSANVLEHIESDQEELAAYSRILRPASGYLCLFVPARPEIYAPIDADFGHFRRYRREELQSKLTNAGFQIVQLRYFNGIGYFAWWAIFCLLQKRSFNPRSVRYFDRFIFPLVHGFETNFFAPPLGQSLIAVARAV